MSIRPAALAIACAILCFPFAPSAARAAPRLPMLHAQGTKWVDEKGGPVILKGCNLGNWLMQEMWMHGFRTEGIPDQYALEEVLARRFGEAARDTLMRTYRDHYITARDFTIIKSFGMNVVRIPFWHRLLEDDAHPFQLKPDAWVYLDRAIGLAEAEGIYAILDLHGAPGSQNPWQHSGRENRNELWGSDENRRRTVWLWQQIARRYRGRTAVAGYDLLNEPYFAGEAELRELAFATYDAIRAADPDHIVILPALPGGFEFYGDLKARGMTNVAVTMHFYPGFFGWGEPTIETHREWLTKGAYEWRDRVEAAGVPALVGEMNVVLKKAGGAEMMRRAFDTYASFGWATTMWSYKVLSREGGIGGGSWGLVTNSPGEGAPLVKADTWNCPGWDGPFAEGCVSDGTGFTAPGAGPATFYLVLKAGAIAGEKLDVAFDEISLTDRATGANAVRSGSFGASDGWREWRHAGSISADCAYAAGAPSGGAGPALRLTADGYANGGVYQPVTLDGGHTYALSGAFSDIGSSRDAAWAEVYLRPDPPVEGQDYRPQPAPGSTVDPNTSSFDEIQRYFESLSKMDYAVYEDLRRWLTTTDSPRPLAPPAAGPDS